MGWTCPRCGARLKASATECHGCGMPTVFMEADDALAPPGGTRAVEPEVLASLEEAERTRRAAPARHVGCSVGPGCGCLGLPLAALVGVAVSSAVALLWVLRLGRVPASLLELASRVRRRASSSG